MHSDPDTYRAESLESWREVAPGWEARREWLMDITAPVIDWIVERLGPEPGHTVLDIAAGTGDLGFRVADRVGAEGEVLCTDFAPEMLDAARRNGAGRGLENVEFRVLDAERMDLADDSVDGAVCRFGYMLMADPAAALEETRRVLRDDGRLSFAVWAGPDRNPWAAVPGMTLIQRGHLPPPEPGAPGIFAMGDPDRIRELVLGAGFGEPEVEEIAFDYHYADADDLWDALIRLAGPWARIFNSLPEDERQATREAIVANSDSYRNEDGSYSEPAMSWGVLAR